MCDRAFVHFSFSTKLTPDLYSPLISQLIYLQEIRNITHQEQQPQGGLPLHNIHKILDFISCAIADGVTTPLKHRLNQGHSSHTLLKKW
ncbi:hypothetical protein, partial [Microcoleus sp. CZ3-B4]